MLKFNCCERIRQSIRKVNKGKKVDKGAGAEYGGHEDIGSSSISYWKHHTSNAI